MPVSDYLSFMGQFQGFSYESALAGLLLIIPIILLYLLRPKPKRIKIPSVMFIHRVDKDKRFSSFLRKFIRDPLLLLQLLLIILLVLALAGPYFTSVLQKRPPKDIVYVIDSSASMQATDTGESRFKKATKLVKEDIQKLDKKSNVDVILSSSVPIRVSASKNPEQVSASLSKVECSDSTTNLHEGISYGIDLLSSANHSDKRIQIYSDFAEVSPREMEIVTNLAKNRNISLQLEKTKNNASNVGIIHAQAKRLTGNWAKAQITATVKNYGREKEITLRFLKNEKKIGKKQVSLEKGEEKVITVESDVSRERVFFDITIQEDDHLAIDNQAELFLPEVSSHKVLLIAKKGENKFLRHAMQASSHIQLKTASFPVIPDFESFDAVVMGDFSRNYSLPGVFRDLRSYIKDGGNLIVFASPAIGPRMKEKSGQAEISELMPVSIEKNRLGKESFDKKIEHPILDNVVTSNIVIKRYYETKAKNKTQTIGEIDNSPALVHWQSGGGKVMYVGVNPDKQWSNFYLSSSLPIFTQNLIAWINKPPFQLNDHNHRAGQYINLNRNSTVTTPSGESISSRNILLDETGVYRVNSYSGRELIFTVNLFNDEESNIDEDFPTEKYQGEKRKDTIEKIKELTLWEYIAAIVLLLLLVEIWIYRKRGKI